MTRAAERLIVCGSQGKYRPAGCWYDLIVEGLTGKPGFEEIGAGDARVWRYRVAPDLVSLDLNSPDLGDASARPAPATCHDEPAWLTVPAAGETAGVVTLNTSTAYDEIP